MSEIPRRRPHLVFLKVKNEQADSGNKSLERLKVNPEELREDSKLVLKHRNCLTFLNNRELGATAGVQAKKEFYQMMASHKRKASSSNLSIPLSYDSCEVNFIKGDDKSLYGVWCIRNDRKQEQVNIRGEISYTNMNNEDYVPPVYKRCKNIIDMCRGGTRGFITVCSYPPEHLPSFVDVLNVRVNISEELSPPPWYCCWFFDRRCSAVLGGNGYLLVINLDRTRKSPRQVSLPGKVYTISENSSSVFFIGLHTGDCVIDDPRANGNVCSIKISDKAVNDSIFVNDQDVIVTDVEGKLVKVDLRTRKASATFFGHKHSITKRPFSVANDMLCATGADNIVRIWHISGGCPIHVHKSTSGHEGRGWLNSDGNKTYLNYFESDTRTVYTI